MIGANEMALPRLGSLSFWLQLFGGVLLYFSFATGSAPAAGWFSYAPLSEKAFSPGPGVDYWALALLMVAGGSIGSAINLIVTIATGRAPGMTMRLVPLFVWMTLVTSVMIVFALPALVMLLSDRWQYARFFDPSQGGAP
jgi:cytochrome c oxidase subunit 1/cytochrome c oxidase subunit I+III